MRYQLVLLAVLGLMTANLGRAQETPQAILESILPAAFFGPSASNGLRHVTKPLELLKNIEAAKDCDPTSDTSPDFAFGVQRGRIVSEQHENRPGEYLLIRVRTCHEAVFGLPTALLIRPANSSDWFGLFDTMDVVQTVRTYGQSGTGDTDLIVTGAQCWTGSGRSPVIEHVSLVDSKKGQVLAKDRTRVSLPSDW